MAITKQERVGKAIELLRQGLAPFAGREFKSLHKGRAGANAPIAMLEPAQATLL